MSNLKLNKLLIHKTLGKVFKRFLLTLNSSKNKTNKNTKKKKITLPSPILVIIPILSATLEIQLTKESSNSNISITHTNNKTEVNKIVEKKINATVEKVWMKNVYGPIHPEIRSSFSVKSIIEAKVTCFRSYDAQTDEQ